jgi:hypothetical protein
MVATNRGGVCSSNYGKRLLFNKWRSQSCLATRVLVFARRVKAKRCRPIWTAMRVRCNALAEWRTVVEHKANEHHRRAVISDCLHSWFDLRNAMQRSRVFDRAAALMLRRNVLRRGLKNWQSAQRSNRHAARKQAKAIIHYDARHLSTAFMQWKRFWQRGGDVDSPYEGPVARKAVRRLHADARRCLKLWSNFAQLARSRRTAESTLRSRTSHRLLSNAFRCWRQEMQATRGPRSRAQRLNSAQTPRSAFTVDAGMSLRRITTADSFNFPPPFSSRSILKAPTSARRVPSSSRNGLQPHESGTGMLDPPLRSVSSTGGTASNLNPNPLAGSLTLKVVGPATFGRAARRTVDVPPGATTLSQSFRPGSSRLLASSIRHAGSMLPVTAR